MVSLKSLNSDGFKNWFKNLSKKKSCKTSNYNLSFLSRRKGARWRVNPSNRCFCHPFSDDGFVIFTHGRNAELCAQPVLFHLSCGTFGIDIIKTMGLNTEVKVQFNVCVKVNGLVCCCINVAPIHCDRLAQDGQGT